MIQYLSEYFKGQWKFERTIQFADSMLPYAKAEGSAIWETSDEPDTLQYQEKGALQMATNPSRHPFFRNYKYVITPEGLDIYFNDELTKNFNLYQQYDYLKEANKLIPKEIHVCNKDLYEGDFCFSDEAHFTHHSVIKGPHKNYIITTGYTKMKT